MARIVASRSGRSHYVLLKDEHDVQAARDLGKYVKESYEYNSAVDPGDVVGPYSSRSDAAEVQGPINEAAQKLRTAAESGAETVVEDNEAD